MKGFTHFMSGVAVASFFPAAVEASFSGNPSLLILGGVAGLLPDTLDFKFVRYFYRYDHYVEIDPERLDAQAVADAVASAIRTAESGMEVRLKLCALRLPGGNWRQYRVAIDSATREVRVQFGPVVDTGQVPLGEGEAAGAVARAAIPGPVNAAEDLDLTIDIFDGPGLCFIPASGGAVDAVFLPWHRTWTHSFFLCALLGGVVVYWNRPAGIVVALAMALHLIEDQAGRMGSSLLFPFIRRRVSGLRWMRSADPLPNSIAVWLACAIVFWNFQAVLPTSQAFLSVSGFVLIVAGVPVLGVCIPTVFRQLARWSRRVVF